MIERRGDNATLEIRRIVGHNALGPVSENVLGTNNKIPITPRSVRRFMLMQEDCIQLEFSLADAVHIAIGDYVDDPLFGKFYVTEEVMPKYNTSTGGYDYSLKLEADYMLWKNWIHCLTVDVGNVKQRMESEWGLTDKLQVHAQQVADEVNILIGEVLNESGGQGGGNIDRSVDYYSSGYCIQVHDSAAKANEVHYIAYNGKNILELLKLMADTWECEWWVTKNTPVVIVKDNQSIRYTKVIHFGKMENNGATYAFNLGQNVESMDIAKDQQIYATRLYAYGGTQNIPEDYDRKLEFTVTDNDATDGFKDKNRPLTLAMIASAANIDVHNFAFGNGHTSSIDSDRTEVEHIQETSSATLTGKHRLEGELAVSFTIEHDDWSGSHYLPPTVNAVVLLFIGSTSTTLGTLNNITPSSVGSGYKRWSVNLPVDLEINPTNQPVYFQVVWTVVYEEASMHVDSYASDPVEDAGTSITATEDDSNATKLVTVTPEGSENGLAATFSGYTSRIKFNGSAPSGWDVGKKYTVGPLTLKVPLSYYTPVYETGTLSKVGDRRLHLPVSLYPNRYLPATEPLDNTQMVEAAIIFNDIFPKLRLRIKAGTLGGTPMRQRIDHSDGSVSWEDWTQYKFRLEYCTDEDLNTWADFPFLEDYMLDGAKLQAVFTAPKDMQQSGFMLSGMTFDVGYQSLGGQYGLYTIIRNEDYGVKLPDNTLKPSVHDELFLTGWNPRAMNEMGLVDIAENELKTQALAYYQALKDGQFTFTCRMMSGWFFDLYGNGNFITSDNKNFLVKAPGTEESEDLGTDQLIVGNGSDNYLLLGAGDKVKVYHDALNEDSNQERCKTSRIIGYEYKLDKPYDTPTYTVGETEAYSRIKQLEKKITKLS